jgi:hypothetical protein
LFQAFLLDTMTTYTGRSGLTTILRVKLTEVLYVLRVWHWFSILRSQADTSRTTYLGYLEGTLPVGGELVGTLLGKHVSKHQIVHLELSAMHKTLMITSESLMVSCIFNSRLLSSFIDEVDVITLELVLGGFVVCLDTEGAHGDLRGEEGLGPVHHKERRLSSSLTG